MQTVERRIRFPDGAAYARINTQALVGMNPQAGGTRDEERFALVARIAEASAPVLAAHADGPGAIADVAITHLASARVPQNWG